VTGGTWDAGPRIIAGSLWMLGPEGYLVGMAIDSLARIGGESRAPNEKERKLLTTIFNDELDLAAITLTDTKGKSGRPFTFPSPRPETQVNLNLGDLYKKEPDFSTSQYPSKLAHEATHAFQYRHMSNASSYILHGIFDSNYDPGTIGKDWKHYNIEQQATIVERWVREHYDPNDDQFGLASPAALDDKKFQYIAGNIRTGKA
jgi:hypothetical protein